MLLCVRQNSLFFSVLAVRITLIHLNEIFHAFSYHCLAYRRSLLPTNPIRALILGIKEKLLLHIQIHNQRQESEMVFNRSNLS
jgi:hypothetical protein